MRLFVTKGLALGRTVWEFAPNSKQGSYRRRNPATGKWEYSKNPPLMVHKVEEDLASRGDKDLTEAKADYIESQVDKRSDDWRDEVRDTYKIPSDSSSPESIKLFLNKVKPGGFPVKDHAGLYLPPWVSEDAAHIWNDVLDRYADTKGWEKEKDVWKDNGRDLGPEDLDYRSLHYRFIESVRKYTKKSLDAYDWFVAAVEEECDF